MFPRIPGFIAPDGGVPLQVKIGTFTRAFDGASGNVSYTGVGFRPRAVLFLSTVSSVAGYASVGFDDGTNRGILLDYHNQTASSWQAATDACIKGVQSSTLHQAAVVASMDADGFTLTWTRTGVTGAATLDVVYLAIR